MIELSNTKNTYQIIEIHRISSDVIKAALTKWLLSYRDKLAFDFEFKMRAYPNGLRTVEPSVMLSPELFCYLVNYLKYPNDHEHQGEVIGFFKSKKLPFEGFLEFELLIYCEPEAEEDTVNILTKENLPFLFDFVDSKISPSEKKASLTYRAPTIEGHKKTTVVKLTPLTDDKAAIAKSIKAFNKRYLIVAVILSVLAVLISIFNSSYHGFFAATLGIGAWIMAEHDALKYWQNFLKLLLPAILMIVIYIEFGIPHEKLPISLFTLSLSFLLMQPIFRYIFIRLINREPDFGKTGKTLYDFLYSVLLLAATLTLNFYFLYKLFL